ncbi:MAG: superoxide dismutase [Gammaproteobacteria bacterium]
MSPEASTDNAVLRLESPELPWVTGALSPVISSRTLQYHFSHHHTAYVAAANTLLEARADLWGKSQSDLVKWLSLHEPESSLFQNVSEACNHSFLWQSLSPERQRPTGALRQALERTFGDYSRFAGIFAEAGARHFGSGWLWLSVDGTGHLAIDTTVEADMLAIHGQQCLLTIDLWEHAYYLDHQDRRREYLDAVIDRRLNWQFAQDNLTALDPGTAQRRGPPTCNA